MDQNSEENVLRLKQGQNSYSSDSDADIQTSDQMKTIRKVSTRRQLRRKKCIKEGILLKQTSSSFQRWKQRYFKLKSCRLFYAKTEDSEIFNEIDLNGCSVAETSHKNINCSFSVIGSTYQLILCAETRKGMDEWITAIRAQKNHQLYSPDQSALESVMEGHNWYACAHSRPTYCNVCREALSGVTNHGLSCDVCTFKAHKKCASRATASCKWSNLSSTGKNIVEDEDGIYIIHQWLEGNLPVNAKCVVCEKTCGSVLRLQDWKCLWCRSVVSFSHLHTSRNRDDVIDDVGTLILSNPYANSMYTRIFTSFYRHTNCYSFLRFQRLLDRVANASMSWSTTSVRQFSKRGQSRREVFTTIPTIPESGPGL